MMTKDEKDALRFVINMLGTSKKPARKLQPFDPVMCLVSFAQTCENLVLVQLFSRVAKSMFEALCGPPRMQLCVAHHACNFMKLC